MTVATFAQQRYAILTAAPEEEFVNQLQVRPSCLQRWLVLFRVKFSTLGERSFSCRMMRQIRIQITEPSLGWSFYILSQLTEGLFVGGRALKRLTENMWTTWKQHWCVPIKLIQDCSSPTSGYIGSVSTPLFWVTYSTISCSAARFTSFHFKSERGSDTKSKRTQHWRIFWINSSSRSPWLASFNWGSLTSSLFWLMLNLKSQKWIGFECTLHNCTCFFSTQILALLWDLLELWRLSFFIWLGPAYLQVVLLRSIPYSSQCREKNHDHQSSHVNRYHDIMTIDHFDQNLLISKYHHFTNNHLLTSFCWSGLVEALEGLLSQQSLKGKNCIFFRRKVIADFAN